MVTPLTATTEAPPLSLAAGVAHDLRNVLFVITAHCERLLTDIDPADPRAEDLQAMYLAAERGVALARQMLSDAQGGDRAARPVDVNEVIRGLHPLVTRLAGDRVALALSLAGGASPVTANAVQIEQIVMNLVVNARDAMPGGGRLTIATENRRAVDDSGTASHGVVISVTDTGTGIDPDVLEHIFEAYFTTRAASGGTGVGLATVRAIALLHDGHVEVSSAPGEGATLRVVLPRAGSPAGPSDDDDATGVATVGKRILLIEQERSVRDDLHRCLAAEGYDVWVAATGVEALHGCNPLGGPVDLVVTDVHLPDIVAKRLRAQWPGLGVVFMSGEVDALERLSERGRVPVLAKPFTASQLVSAVRTVLTAAAA